MNRGLFSSCLVTLAIFSSVPAIAAEQPDAGRTLQDLRQAPQLPAPSPAISVRQPERSAIAPGGPQVTIQSIRFEGNTVFSDEQLRNALDQATGNAYDLSGLRGIADRVTAYYHEHDYAFARAFIPAQSMTGGTLLIRVVEGLYGDVSVKGENVHAPSARNFLHDLERGSIITGSALERASLILDDQPGYKVTPVIRPGQDMGTGDLSFLMEREKSFGGSVRLDNHGNRYTGRVRARMDLYGNSLLAFGDQASISGIYTDEDMWFGSLGYSLPVGYSGLRGNVGYTHTYYQLGKNFSALDAHGTADVVSGGLSYPLIRSQDANLSLSAHYQHKWLKDEQGSTGTSNRKTSHSLPIALGFDRRDTILGGGITYGVLSWTPGALDLDNGLKTADSTTARSDGGFSKFNLDVARLQATPVQNLVLFARASGQMATGNLDSSEDFGLGGPEGVRAYPTGEGYGDEGVLAQIEIRYTIDAVTPYVFYDYGHTRINADPWDNSKNSRSIGGGGFGMRFDYKGWNADASAAWRTVGNDPQSDDKDQVPMVWLRLGYSF